MQRPTKTRPSRADKTHDAPAMRGYLPHYLSRLMNILNLRLMEHLRPLDLTMPQFRVMQVIDARQTASVGTLARDAVIEQSVVSRIVDQLEKRGYAKRAKRPGNARIVDVSLTKEGRAAYASLMPLAHAIVDDAVSVLSPAERNLLDEMLKRLFDHATTPRFPWLMS
ncbi:MarR family transcriptional regulator [Vineibacter terrae]|uniref:MarR family winged helix-turn-helix transcriptional regulator n=1 Tax=Vineibacter terrae TaxID=2586908 RepID=UPI002E3108FE|nr:MarR family transcriptional regulator [Vineibacter terrae]HEX2889485.1 MarR family transcriptional regulator [Vineibacter terrae]